MHDPLVSARTNPARREAADGRSADGPSIAPRRLPPPPSHSIAATASCTHPLRPVPGRCVRTIRTALVPRTANRAGSLGIPCPLRTAMTTPKGRVGGPRLSGVVAARRGRFHTSHGRPGLRGHLSVTGRGSSPAAPGESGGSPFSESESGTRRDHGGVYRPGNDTAGPVLTRTSSLLSPSSRAVNVPWTRTPGPGASLAPA
jgi:hypothetical protein